MTPALLAAVGKALYGPLWQSELGRNVGVATRTVQRWAAGRRPIPDDLSGELAELCRLKHIALDDITLRLSEAMRPS